MTKKGALIAVSVAGLFSAMAPNFAAAGPKKEGGDKIVCEGVNSCKGTGSCAGAGHACAGQNACKGQGHTKTTKKDCLAKGGKVVEKEKEKKE